MSSSWFKCPTRLFHANTVPQCNGRIATVSILSIVTTADLVFPGAGFGEGIEEGVEVASVEPSAATGAFVELVVRTRSRIRVIAVRQPSAVDRRNHMDLASRTPDEESGRWGGMGEDDLRLGIGRFFKKFFINVKNKCKKK